MKYPRILHIPGSPGTSSDDRIMTDSQWAFLATLPVVATEKMDGENTTMTSVGIHARSEDSIDHESRHYVKGLWGGIRHLIPAGWRICGENLYARHSVAYTDLDSWFQVFGIYNEYGALLSDGDCQDMALGLGLGYVPHLGIFPTGEEAVAALRDFDSSQKEGFVIRRPGYVHAVNHETSIAKWVRRGHVQTGDHWMYQSITVNGVRDE